MSLDRDLIAEARKIQKWMRKYAYDDEAEIVGLLANECERLRDNQDLVRTESANRGIELQETHSRLSRLEEAAKRYRNARLVPDTSYADAEEDYAGELLDAALSGDDSQQTAPSMERGCNCVANDAWRCAIMRDYPGLSCNCGCHFPDSATDSQPEGVMRNSGPNVHGPDVAVPEQENAEVRARTDNSVVRDVQPRAAGELVATGEALDGKPAATISAPAPASISEAERKVRELSARAHAAGSWSQSSDARPDYIRQLAGEAREAEAAVIEEVRKLERFAQAFESEARHYIAILEQRCQQLERERDEHEAQYLWRALQANETIASVREELAEAHKTATSERQQRERAEMLLHRWKAWYFSETDEDQGWDIGDATKAYFGKREPSPASARPQRTGLE